MLVKKELSGIPLLPVVETGKNNATYVANAAVFELPKSGRILAVDYRRTDEPEELACRFFTDGARFLTVHEWPAICWYEQMPLETGTSYCSNSADVWSPDAVSLTVHDFLQPFDGPHRCFGVRNAAFYVEWFVDRVRHSKRERAAHAREAKMEYHMSLFPPIPDDLPGFLDERVWPTGYAFISKVQRGGVRNARCSRCGAAYKVPSSVKHRAMGACPDCGAAVQYVGEWYPNIRIEDKTTVCINYEVDGDLLIRWTKVTRTMTAPTFAPVFATEDIGSNLHLHEGKKEKLYCYLKKPMPYCSGLFWTRRPMGEPVVIPAHVYTRNLTEVFGECHYRVNLAEAMSGPSAMVDWSRILRALRTEPVAEYLLKLRLPALTGWPLGRALEDGEKPSFARCLGIDGSMLQLYREFNVTPTEHRILKSYGRPVSPRDFRIFRTLRITDHEPVAEALRHLTFTKLVNYFSRQKPCRRGTTYLVRQWLDYIDMCVGLGIDLSRKSTRFPRDIIAAHDEANAAFLAAKAESEDALFRARTEPLYATLPMTEWARDGMLARLPRSRTELTAEGKSLHHCVWGDNYFKRHAAGTHLIVFIRKAEAPETPWFTMELRMEDFHQCQLFGYGNSPAPRAVAAFAARFIKSFKAAITAGKEAAA